MALSLYEQARDLIEKSERILLVAHTKMDGDTLSANIAMHLILKKIGKETVVACADPVPEEYAFLPEVNVMQREVKAEEDFVISVDCSSTQAKKLRWKIEGSTLKIFIAPENGSFSRRDVSFLENGDFDLIISLDAADKKQLGSIFTDNTELFSKTPLIVFDHHASNPGFGTVNIIETKAASTTEVIFHFLPTLLGKDWKKKIDSDIATLLLTGIITDTGSFQNPNTTPKSLEVSADLVELGARQQEIIRNIFKTKNIQTLKLWGRVLSKIKTDPIHRMLWSTVSKDDLIDTGGNIEDTGAIIDELLATAPGMEMVILLKERPDGIITTSVRTTTPLCDASAFAADFGGGGHTQAAGFKIRGNKPFEVVIGEVISTAQSFQANRLRLFPEKAIPQKKEQQLQQKKKIEMDVSGEAKPTAKPVAVEIHTEKQQKRHPERKKNKHPKKKHTHEAETPKATPPVEKKEIFPLEKKAAQIVSPVPERPVQKEIPPVQESVQQKEKQPEIHIQAPPSAPKGEEKKEEDISHQFSEMLEKMMNVDPVEATKNAPPKKPK